MRVSPAGDGIIRQFELDRSMLGEDLSEPGERGDVSDLVQNHAVMHLTRTISGGQLREHETLTPV